MKKTTIVSLLILSLLLPGFTGAATITEVMRTPPPIGSTTPNTGNFTTLEADTVKFTTGAAAGKILTSDADGDGSWADAPSGTVPNSGTSTTAALIADGAGGWAVSEAGQAHLTNPLAPAQAIAMTAAASGSSGIAVADNDNIDFGTGNFSVHVEAALPTWTPAGLVWLVDKVQDADNRWGVYISPATGRLSFFGQKTGGTAISVETPTALTLNAGSMAKITCVITRETAGTAGSAAVYVNSALLATIAIPAGTPADLSNSGSLAALGYLVSSYAGTVQSAYLFNFALTAAEVASLHTNGSVPESWKLANGQTALTSGTLVAGKQYQIDTFAAGDDFTNIGGTNASGSRFVATGTTPTTWTNGSSVRPAVATLLLEPEGIQPAPGQWLDASSNKLHAMQPAAGSSLVRPKRDGEVRWTNTWAGSHEAQYIGGVNQAILPANAYIESIVGVITGSTVEDIIVGDGSDTDRWVALTSGLAAGTVAFTLANRISDGTNRKMAVDPDANFTGSIVWTIKYTILD